MQRRRFLATSVSAALLLTGCGRWLRDDAGPDTAAPPEDPRPTPEPPEAPEAPSVVGEEPTGEQPDDGVAEDPELETEAPEPEPPEPGTPEVDPALYDAIPTEWGEAVTGVGRRLAGTSAIALTFDACGGPNGSGYDAALIGHLRHLDVPATLFVNERWLDANPAVFAELADDPLFEIANHGTRHRPLSVDGRSAYGITGTGSVDEVIDEVMGCQRRLTELTGTAPRFFGSGTAYYDDVAVRVVHELGLEVAGYSVLGDAGATFSAAQVRDALLGAGPGDIALLHMNHPASGTAEGVAAALPTLLDRGATFTTLGDHELA